MNHIGQARLINSSNKQNKNNNQPHENKNKHQNTPPTQGEKIRSIEYKYGKNGSIGVDFKYGTLCLFTAEHPSNCKKQIEEIKKRVNMHDELVKMLKLIYGVYNSDTVLSPQNFGKFTDLIRKIKENE